MAFEVLKHYWPHLVSLSALLCALVTSCHVLLNKRDSRSATGWLGMIWFTPFLGSTLYVLLGINRIRRKAHLARHRRTPPNFNPTDLAALPLATRPLPLSPLPVSPLSVSPLAVSPLAVTPPTASLSSASPWVSLKQLGNRMSPYQLCMPNVIEPLDGPEKALTAMLEAIFHAQKSILLLTYIFDRSGIGRDFLAALEKAKKKGLSIRVLIDAIGARTSFPTAARDLRRMGIRVALYRPVSLPLRLTYFNLRNHRKAMIVDDVLAFTGGMNIRCSKHVLLRDLHFRITGPLVRQIQHAFYDDWFDTTQESLPLPPLGNNLRPPGASQQLSSATHGENAGEARVILDGPDENFERHRLMVLGALACAKKSVKIVTPYLLPDSNLISALSVTALRGVMVTVIIPETSNLRLVQWACMGTLWQILEHGVEVFLSAPPFDHTKLMIVDDCWSYFGSANWDMRSFRLNFELNVECYDPQLAQKLLALFCERLTGARRLLAQELSQRPWLIQLRDATARLALPYL